MSNEAHKRKVEKMKDPRGPNRVITEVVLSFTDGTTKLVLECGHTRKANQIYHYKTGDKVHCLQCLNIDVKNCSHCKRGGIIRPADLLVKGRIYIDNDKMIPYKAYLCEDHYLMLLDDEAILKIEKRLGEYLDKYLDYLTQEYTRWKSFKEMCKNNPTLRSRPKALKDEKEDIHYLRTYFKYRTGGDAAE